MESKTSNKNNGLILNIDEKIKKFSAIYEANKNEKQGQFREIYSEKFVGIANKVQKFKGIFPEIDLKEVESLLLSFEEEIDKYDKTHGGIKSVSNVMSKDKKKKKDVQEICDGLIVKIESKLKESELKLSLDTKYNLFKAFLENKPTGNKNNPNSNSPLNNNQSSSSLGKELEVMKRKELGFAALKCLTLAAEKIGLKTIDSLDKLDVQMVGIRESAEVSLALSSVVLNFMRENLNQEKDLKEMLKPLIEYLSNPKAKNLYIKAYKDEQSKQNKSSFNPSSTGVLSLSNMANTEKTSIGPFELPMLPLKKGYNNDADYKKALKQFKIDYNVVLLANFFAINFEYNQCTALLKEYGPTFAQEKTNIEEKFKKLEGKEAKEPEVQTFLAETVNPKITEIKFRNTMALKKARDSYPSREQDLSKRRYEASAVLGKQISVAMCNGTKKIGEPNEDTLNVSQGKALSLAEMQEFEKQFLAIASNEFLNPDGSTYLNLSYDSKTQELSISNSGDSLAFLTIRNKETGEYQTIRLTKDHNLEDQEECLEIYADTERLNQNAISGKVFLRRVELRPLESINESNGLQVSRSFGDKAATRALSQKCDYFKYNLKNYEVVAVTMGSDALSENKKNDVSSYTGLFANGKIITNEASNNPAKNMLISSKNGVCGTSVGISFDDHAVIVIKGIEGSLGKTEESSFTALVMDGHGGALLSQLGAIAHAEFVEHKTIDKALKLWQGFIEGIEKMKKDCTAEIKKVNDSKDMSQDKKNKAIEDTKSNFDKLFKEHEDKLRDNVRAQYESILQSRGIVYDPTPEVKDGKAESLNNNNAMKQSSV